MSDTATSPAAAEPQLSNIARIAMVTAVMLAMMLEMLDMTVVNVALPHMMGAFGATNDQITWVVTSYMVAAAVMMPLTGYLVQKFGRRRLLLADISLFLIASMACGMSQTLEQMVFFRILQGLSGATLAPLSQAIMMSTFTRENRGSAMAVWGLGMMVVPVLGPTFGGFLTDVLNWRWVFYVNIPLGLMALLMASAYVPGEPSSDRAQTDWFGLTLLVIFVGSLQLVLNQGNSRDWFNSSLIQGMAFVSAISGLMFLHHTWDNPKAIVNLSVFKDRNFTVATLLVVAFSIGLFGIMTLLPLMLEQLMHYPAQMVGSVMAPRGLAMALMMFIIGPFVGRFDPRGMMLAGAIVLAAGTYVYAIFPMDVSPGWVAIPGLLQGVGMALFFIPSSMLAYETLPKHLYDGAAGLYAVIRTTGASVGIAVISLLLARRADYHWRILGENITPENPNLHSYLDARGMTLADPGAAPTLVGEVMRQAQFMAFADMFIAVSVVVLFSAPLVLLMRKPNRKKAEATAAAVE